MVKVEKRLDGRWIKSCPNCNEIQDYLRKNYAEQSLKLNKVCKKCSNRITENNHRGLYNTIRLSWFSKTENSAKLRGLVFDLTIEDVWSMYIFQKKRCALSGLLIGWSEVGSIHTASIDRIDSAEGYTRNNIQLVHKDVNFMKQQYSQEYFLSMCRLISNKIDQ